MGEFLQSFESLTGIDGCQFLEHPDYGQFLDYPPFLDQELGQFIEGEFIQIYQYYDPPVKEDDQPARRPSWKSRAFNCLVTFVSCTTLLYDERTGTIKPRTSNITQALESDEEFEPSPSPKKQKKKKKGKKTTTLSSPSAPLQSITGLLNSPSQQKKRKRQTQSSGEEETGVSSSREVAATATARPSTGAASTTAARAQRIEDYDITGATTTATAPSRRISKGTRDKEVAASLDTTKQDALAKPDDADDNNNHHPDTELSSLFQDDVLSRRRVTSYGLEQQPNPSESDDEDDEYYYERPFVSLSNIELPPPRPLSRKIKRSPFYNYINNPNKNVPKEQNYNWHDNNNDTEEEEGDVINELDAVGKKHNVKRAGVAFMGDKSQVRMLFVYHFPPIDALLMQYGTLYCLCAGALPMNFTVHITLNMLILVSMMLYGLRFTNAMPIIMESIAWVDIVPYFFPHDVCDKKKRNSEEYKVYQAVEKDLDTLAARYISYLTHFFPNLQVVIFAGAAWDYYVLHPGMVDTAMVPQDKEQIRLAHLSSFRFGALYEHVVAWGRVLSAAFALAFGVKDPLPTMEQEEFECFVSMLVQNRRNEASWKLSIKEGMANMTEEARAKWKEGIISNRNEASWKLSIKEGMANMTEEARAKWRMKAIDKGLSIARQSIADGKSKEKAVAAVRAKKGDKMADGVERWMKSDEGFAIARQSIADGKSKEEAVAAVRAKKGDKVADGVERWMKSREGLAITYNATAAKKHLNDNEKHVVFVGECNDCDNERLLRWDGEDTFQKKSKGGEAGRPKIISCKCCRDYSGRNFTIKMANGSCVRLETEREIDDWREEMHSKIGVVNEEDDSSEDGLGCVCGSTHPAPTKVFWIMCDDCDAWYNVAEECVGFDKITADKLDKWSCRECDQSQNLDLES